MTSTVCIEAEHMSRSGGFAKVYGDQASSGKLVKLACGDQGALKTDFSGQSGTYDLKIHAQDEYDGASYIDVYVGGEKVGRVNLDSTTTWERGSDHGGFDTFTLSDLEINPGDKIELRAYRDGCEYVRIDKIELEYTGPVGDDCAKTEVLVDEDFSGACRPDDLDTIVRDDGWDLSKGALRTSGGNDGVVAFKPVELDGHDEVALTFDVKADCVAPFEYSDWLRVELVIDGSTVVVLDEFRKNGHVFEGSISGQTFGESYSTLSYAGTDLPDGAQDVQIRFVSCISWCDEIIRIDNVKLTAEADACSTCPDGYVKLDFNDLPAGETVSDQYEGVTITAIANGANKICIQAEDFDTIESGRIKWGKYASDKEFVKLGCDGGLIATDFTGSDGTYTISIDIQDETDGAGTVEVYVDGAMVGTFEVSGKEAESGWTGGSKYGGFSTFTLSSPVAIDKGDEVKIVYKDGGGEYGRIDKVTFEGTSSANRAMIFDTDNPTGGDYDLTNGDGNVLIISEDGDSSDPDDNAKGGTLEFAFDDPTDLSSIDVIDTEEGGVIIALDADGNEIGRVDIPHLADNGVATVDLDFNGVSKLVVTLNGSGAVDDLCYKPGPNGGNGPGTASLGDTVWFDANKNGVLDNGEQGVDGVTVNLLSTLGIVLETTTTANGGQYLFDNLNAGDYVVEFDGSTTGGLAFTTEGTDADDATNNDSDADQTTGRTGVITLSDGEAERDVDAGLVDPGTASLGDTVWFDANKNGVLDNGEQGVANVSVELLDDQGNVIATDTTDGAGQYLFDNLDAGDYQVRFDGSTTGGLAFTSEGSDADDVTNNDSDADQTTGLTDMISLSIGEAERDVDAGLVDPGTASLGDTVWLDANENGVLDNGEQGVADVSVELLDDQGNVIATDVTDGAGQYLFTGLDAGNYRVRFDGTTTGGLIFTTQAVVAAEAVNNDSDADAATGLTDLISLSIGEAERDVDAGLIEPNTPPVAADDAAMGCADEFILLDVLADNGNGADSDADGDPLTVSQFNGAAIADGQTVVVNGTATVTDRDGNVTSEAFTGLSATLNGSSFTFDGVSAFADLEIGEKAEVSFTYEISDGEGGFDTADIDLTFCGALNTLESIAASLPDTATFGVGGFFVGTAYQAFVLNTGNALLDNQLFDAAYCIDRDEDIVFFDTTIPADLYVGADGLAPSSLGLDGDWDLINWIINQDFTSQSNGDTSGLGAGLNYTDTEVQAAIWGITNGNAAIEDPGLVGGVYNGLNANAQEILDLALANGEGYTPGAGDLFAIVLDPQDTYGGVAEADDHDQPFIIAVSFDDFSQECIC